MTEQERFENLRAQVADLKEAEAKIRTVRQDLQGQAWKIASAQWTTLTS